MKQTPILFNAEMVRAILANRKKLTRRLDGLENLNASYYKDRIGKVELRDGLWCFWERETGSSALPCLKIVPGYEVAGRLWVRESFYNDVPDEKYIEHIYYRADGECCAQIPECQCATEGKVKWTPSIHMPRWASRLTLEITSVKVERLRDITTEDIIADGLSSTLREYDAEVDLRDKMINLWDSIYGGTPESWTMNPWVWVVSFRRVEK